MYIVFDYDGVIIDSVPPVLEAIELVHATIGVRPPSADEARAHIGPSMRAGIEAIRERFGVPEHRQAELEALYFEAYTRAAGAKTLLFDGIDRLLSELVADGVPIALATMKAQTEFDAIGVPLPGINYFDILVAPPDHLGYTKKQLVAEALERLRESHALTEPGLMIGDRATDIEAGKAHDLVTVGTLWGGGSIEELAAAQPHHVARDVGELRRLLERR